MSTEWRFFEYGGEFGGTILQNNTSFPRYYCLGLKQRRLTWSWFNDPKISQKKQDQSFEAAVSRAVNSRISQKSAKGEQKKRIKQTVRQRVNHWRTFNPSKYNSFVKEMLQDKPIWSKYYLRSGTCWMISHNASAYNDLPSNEQVYFALAEADVGVFLELQRKLNPLQLSLPN